MDEKDGIRCLRFEAGGSPFFVPVDEVGQLCEASPTDEDHLDLCALLGMPGTARYRIPLYAEIAFPIDVSGVFGIETVTADRQWALPPQVRNPENAFIAGIGKSEGGVGFLLDPSALLLMAGRSLPPQPHIIYPERKDALGPFLCLLVGEERCVVPERNILTILAHADILPVPFALPGVLGIVWHAGQPVPAFSPASRPCRVLVLAQEAGVVVALGADRLMERVREETRPQNSFCMDIPRLGQSAPQGISR